MPHPQFSPVPQSPESLPERPLERFSVSVKVIKEATDKRLDASHFNPNLARALELLHRSGMRLEPLGEITKRVFVAPRFRRIYVESRYGVPFLQGSHIVHFDPADIKYLSTTANRHLEKWIIEAGWILVTCSGTVGRVVLCPPEWDHWAASQHIMRVIPDDAACPAGYLYSFLSSQLGYVQLTSRIYGAVVDELTEEQARSVLVPLPVSDEQKAEVAKIDAEVRKAVSTWSRAVQLSRTAADALAGILYEDKRDSAQRLRELRQRPDVGVSGEALKKTLTQLE